MANINVTHGNIIEADAEALVNTVNCMGKGIALQFKKAFPENFEAYARACRAGEVRPGRMFVFATNSTTNPKYIINFPTKRRWREKSQLEDIEAGLVALVDELRRLNVSSVAIPPLGCGLGGLDWREVRPRIEQAFWLPCRGSALSSLNRLAHLMLETCRYAQSDQS
jgi:O-acetyl-ADP-ribose deacetylase (regulator of RNase III)